jgi:hypothetical protein
VAPRGTTAAGDRDGGGKGNGMAQDPQDPRREGQRPARLVRPYAVTGGRTRPAHQDLELETLVSTTALGQVLPIQGVERRQIAMLCRGSLLSIAELSARLDLPLGVVRVLVGDLADQRLVAVHRPSERPDLALLERVLDGLRTL